MTEGYNGNRIPTTRTESPAYTPNEQEILYLHNYLSPHFPIEEMNKKPNTKFNSLYKETDKGRTYGGPIVTISPEDDKGFRRITMRFHTQGVTYNDNPEDRDIVSTYSANNANVFKDWCNNCHSSLENAQELKLLNWTETEAK